MGVYVDGLRPTIQSPKWPHTVGCHLVADKEKELHKFAKKLGLNKKWVHHNKGNMPHYDLTARKRRLAVQLGAVEITQGQLVKMLQKYRSKKYARLPK